GAHLKPARQRFHKPQSIGQIESIVPIFMSNEVGILPNRDAVGPPITAERPARKRLTGVPLPLPEMEKRAGRHSIAKIPQHRQAPASLELAESIDVPLRALRLV